MTIKLLEPLPELFTSSKLMVLDFSQIPEGTPVAENIEQFFAESEAKGENPRLPAQRQVFNNRMLDAVGMRYLVSRYAEDRSAMLTGSQIAAEGRTYHMGIDVFSRDLETVYAPCDGRIVVSGREPENHSYGNYVIMEPADVALKGIHFFFGHLSHDTPTLGPVEVGQPIATLGDFSGNENGGWSRHLHLQLLTELPTDGEAPIGYSSQADLPINQRRFPDPMPYFPDWHVA